MSGRVIKDSTGAVVKTCDRYPAGTRMQLQHPNGMRCEGEIKLWNNRGDEFYFVDVYGRCDWYPERWLQ